MINRSSIIKCPFFRMDTIITDDISFVFYFFCSIDKYIYTDYEIFNKKKISKKDLKKIRKKMIETCSTNCPKIWDIFIDEKKELESVSENYPDFDDLSFNNRLLPF